MLWRVRLGRHSSMNRSAQAHCFVSARSLKRSGASSLKSHLMTLSGAAGFAHGSAWLTEIWPPLAKLVSMAASAWRSNTDTSCPACDKYHAAAVPTTPAPRTKTFIGARRACTPRAAALPARGSWQRFDVAEVAVFHRITERLGIIREGAGGSFHHVAVVVVTLPAPSG